MQNPTVNWITGANTYFNEEDQTSHTKPSFPHNKYSQFFIQKNLFSKVYSMVKKSLGKSRFIH
ncbi:hypothetical protein LXN10_05560 [Arcobacter sp. KX21116]|uniref:hypothetical protein n=1 Tax=Arcobacter iocasae TaxID=2906515 RepID=UPI0035D4A48E